MKKAFLLFFVIVIFSTLARAQQTFNSLNVKDLDVTKKLRVISTSFASKPCPAMTTTQRNALTANVGECVYNTTESKINTYDGTNWKSSGGGVAKWATSSAYAVDDVVIESFKFYICLIAHTSGTFATDLAASRWQEVSFGLTGTVAVGNGGTGQTSLTANNVILGNGTSSVQFVAPGSSGNILKSNGTTWQSVAGGSVVAAKYISTVGQSIPNATETTITYPTAIYDTHSAVSGGVFTCPTGQEGYYQVIGMAAFTNGTTGVRYGYVRGSVIGYSSIARTGPENPSNSSSFSLRYTDIVYLNAGDTVFLTAYQTSGGSLSLRTEADTNIFAVIKIGN